MIYLTYMLLKKKINLLEFYRVKDWIKNLGISLIAFLTATSSFNFSIFQQILLFLVAMILAYAYAFSINDFFDYQLSKEINYIGKIIRKFKEKTVVFLCFVPLICFSLIILFLNKVSSYLLFFFVLFYTLYSIPPFRIKRYYFFSIPVNAICIGLLTYISAYFLLADEITFKVVMFSIIFCSYLVFQEIIHQIAHKKKDKNVSIHSLPNVIGIKKALKISIISQIVPIIGILIALVLDTKNLIFIASIFFSFLRILKISKVTIKTDFNKLRNETYGVYEGVYYVTILTFFSYFYLS